MGENVRSVQCDELTGDDRVEGDGRAEVDACQCEGYETGDIYGVARWVRRLIDLDVDFELARMIQNRGEGSH